MRVQAPKPEWGPCNRNLTIKYAWQEVTEGSAANISDPIRRDFRELPPTNRFHRKNDETG
jgi:hypothetical protein